MGTKTCLFSLALCGILAAGTARGDDLDQPPIRYAKTQPNDAVARLQQRIDEGLVRAEFEEDHGYLRFLLRELKVPVSSQVLVFSKTSLQRNKIGPRTPRALYFNDEVYLGFCWRGDVLEVSTTDPRLGTVFYTLDQKPRQKPRFVRQTDACLTCHGSTLTRGVPGHLIRSVFPDRSGNPILSLGSTRVDHATPFHERWGGWYVTGTSGKQQHRGNLILQDVPDDPPGDNSEGTNVTDLKWRFTVANYLSPHSDLAALLVLEHQAEMHNRLTRANYETRRALYQQEEFDRILGRSTEGMSDSTWRRIQAVGEPLVRYLLFADEAPLTEPVRGTSDFAKEFAAAGPRDAQGRSLRELDLQRRLLRYPCSWLIHSEAFQALPRETREYVWYRLKTILNRSDAHDDFPNLSGEDRRNLRDMLCATLPEFAAYWKGK